MSNEFEITTTVAGSTVRIYARDVGSEKVIHGAYEAGGEWYIAQWQRNGFYKIVDDEQEIVRSSLDLVESLSVTNNENGAA